jgi:hypothetical protein
VCREISNQVTIERMKEKQEYKLDLEANLKPDA